jgi:predicted peptidase
MVVFVLLKAILFCSLDMGGIAYAYSPYSNLFEKDSLVKEGKKLPYRLMKPKNFDTSKHYPLHITLHGAPERGTNNEAQVSVSSVCVAPWALDSERTTRPAFVFAPQCPPDQEWVGVHWNDCGAKLPPVASMAWPGRFVLDMIDTLCRKFPCIDTNRIYISGGSMGGVGTWYLCQYRPDRFTAAFPQCGSGDTTLPMPFVNNIPVWTFAGSKDSVTPYWATRAMIATIRRAGGNPIYTEIAGEGHTVSLIGGAAANGAVHVWLFNQTKQSTSVELHIVSGDQRSDDYIGLYSLLSGFRKSTGGIQIYDLRGRTVIQGGNSGQLSDRKASSIIIWKKSQIH